MSALDCRTGTGKLSVMIKRLGIPLVVQCCLLVALAMSGMIQACGATFIVDQQASGASDGNVGTEEKPFKTVQHAVALAKPGDTIFVMSGTYPERVKVTTSGADGQPITLRAMPRRSVRVEGFDLQASYIRVEGFEITADKRGEPFVHVRCW